MNMDIVIIAALLAANAFFVAAEFALVKAKGVRLEGFASRGARAALKAGDIQKNLDSYLATCQLGITMASLGLGWAGEPAVAAVLTPLFEQMGLPEEMLHTAAFIIGFLIFSSLHIVVGEQVPKTFAIRNPERVSMWIAYPLHTFYLLVLPMNYLLKGATLGILNLLRVPPATHEDVFSHDELKSLVDVSLEHGELHKDKAEMLTNMFAFDRGFARDVMVPQNKIDFLNLQDPIKTSIARVIETQHSRFPVVDGDKNNVVGVLLVKEMLNDILLKNNQNELEIGHYCRNVPFVPELMSASDLFESMRANRSHMVVIVDEYGSVSGLVTMEDLLEEIVGEIADELDEDESEFPIEKVEEGVWLAHGFVSMTQLARATGFRITEAIGANTISGLLMQRLSKVPVTGDSLTEGDFTFTVEAVTGRQVEKVRLQLIIPDLQENI